MTDRLDGWLEDIEEFQARLARWDPVRDEDLDPHDVWSIGEETDEMLNDFGNSKVTVKKDELLAAIKKNRSTHRETFLEAQKGYRAAVIEELDRMLKDAREGRTIRRAVQLVEPQEHTKDYDRVIRMLEMSVADEIAITETQFSQYVLDEWGWTAAFVGSTSNYTNNAR